MRSCSTAPDRNVSQAAIITLMSCCCSQYATCPKHVYVNRNFMMDLYIFMRNSKFNCICNERTNCKKRTPHQNVHEGMLITLAKLVDLPTPLTPTKTMVYGLPASLAWWTSRKISIERFGVRIRSNASSIAACIHPTNLAPIDDMCIRQSVSQFLL